MRRNQNRIEGRYAIVSVMGGRDMARDVRLHHSETRALLEAGATIEQLKGRWNGQEELSIRIYGPNSATVAAEIALEYNQVAFIAVENGAATLWGRVDGGIFESVDTYTSLIEDADATDNYSETMSGFRFRFV